MEPASEVLAVGGGTAGAILLLAYIVRNAISTAVAQAGKAEIVRLQATLTEALEGKRQAFQAALEEARAAAALDLEGYKAELQLASEVRRQVAAKRVEALLRIAVLGEALQRDVLNVRPRDPTDKANAIAKVHEFMGVIRENSVLFSKEVTAKFHQYAADLVRAEHELNEKLDSEALGRAFKAVDGFLELAREQLGVEQSSGREPG